MINEAGGGVCNRNHVDELLGPWPVARLPRRLRQLGARLVGAQLIQM